MGDVEVIVQLATTGEDLATLWMRSTDSGSDLHHEMVARKILDEGSQVTFFYKTVVLDNSTTLAGASVHSGDTVTVVRNMQDIHLWHLSAWDTSHYGNGKLVLRTVSVPMASAREVVQALGDTEGGQLFEIGMEYLRIFDPDDLVISVSNDWLQVRGAGSQAINGKYVRDGMHQGLPRWRRSGCVIPKFDQESTWLRKGSDGNWCIVNNFDGSLPASEKKFFYNSGSDDIAAAAWRTDFHGTGPAPSVSPVPAPDPRRHYFSRDEESHRPSQQLFKHIMEHGRALVLVPPLTHQQRVVVMHIQHFHNETLVYARHQGYVGCESFSGMDDEQISIYDGSTDSGPALFQYIGK